MKILASRLSIASGYTNYGTINICMGSPVSMLHLIIDERIPLKTSYCATLQFITALYIDFVYITVHTCRTIHFCDEKKRQTERSGCCNLCVSMSISLCLQNDPRSNYIFTETKCEQSNGAQFRP